MEVKVKQKPEYATNFSEQKVDEWSLCPTIISIYKRKRVSEVPIVPLLRWVMRVTT